MKEMRNAWRGLSLAVFTLASNWLIAQTTGNWEDNTGNPSPTTTTTQDNVGIGTNSPEAHEEILYCPDHERGLIITKVECTATGAGGVGGATGTWGEVNPPAGGGSIVYPSYLFNFASPVISGAPFPIASITGGGGEPLLWARTQSMQSPGSLALNKSRFIVLPNGKTGINITNPRAALDVMSNYGSSVQNKPLAIFGVRTHGVAAVTVNGVAQYPTKHVAFYNNLGAGAYNPIVQDGDMGFLYTDGLQTDGSNTNGAFVIAPWSTNPSAAGIRLDNLGGMEFKANNIVVSGNAEIRGTMRCNGFKSDPQWWPDFVFEKEYDLMSLDSVALFLKKNKHLPNMPSRENILKNGQNIGEIQQLQQQKIEELTLYNIELNNELKELKRLLIEQNKRTEKLESELERL